MENFREWFKFAHQKPTGKLSKDAKIVSHADVSPRKKMTGPEKFRLFHSFVSSFKDV